MGGWAVLPIGRRLFHVILARLMNEKAVTKPKSSHPLVSAGSGHASSRAVRSGKHGDVRPGYQNPPEPGFPDGSHYPAKANAKAAIAAQGGRLPGGKVVVNGRKLPFFVRRFKEDGVLRISDHTDQGAGVPKSGLDFTIMVRPRFQTPDGFPDRSFSPD